MQKLDNEEPGSRAHLNVNGLCAVRTAEMNALRSPKVFFYNIGRNETRRRKFMKMKTLSFDDFLLIATEQKPLSCMKTDLVG
jgi:hypothetical protein